MTIRRACYVACDAIGCGDTFSASTANLAKDARANAAAHGWKRVRSQDICSRHIERTPGGGWTFTPETRLAQ